jgi:micrococcal nuclease
MIQALGQIAFVALILFPSARLEGIDAPDTGQAFGTKAKRALSDKISGQTVTIKTTGKDRYGRTLGVVWFCDRNINQGRSC